MPLAFATLNALPVTSGFVIRDLAGASFATLRVLRYDSERNKIENGILICDFNFQYSF